MPCEVEAHARERDATLVGADEAVAGLSPTKKSQAWKVCERDATLAVEVSSVVAEQDAALAAEDAALAHRAALAAAVLVLPLAEPVEADGQGAALALVSVMPKAESRVPDGQEAALACFVMPKAESKVPDGQEAALALVSSLRLL